MGGVGVGVWLGVGGHERAMSMQRFSPWRRPACQATPTGDQARIALRPQPEERRPRSMRSSYRRRRRDAADRDKAQEKRDIASATAASCFRVSLEAPLRPAFLAPRDRLFVSAASMSFKRLSAVDSLFLGMR